MPALDEKPWWDPYETSQKRDFIYRPNSSTQVIRPTTTKAFRNPYSLCGPVGSTVYNQDFHWKPVCKPDCIRTGSSSGNRRNNPHPSQSFMVWRLPKGSKQLAADGQSQWKNPPSEEELRNTLTAQYRSTYRTDFLGVPQGYHRNQTILAPLSCKQQAPYSIQTEMRHNYQEPRQKSALQGNMSRYGCNALHEVAPRGIVPTVVHSHIYNQENAAQLTTYDRHFGGKTTDVTTVLGALQPQDLQQFYKLLPERDKEVVQTFLSKGTPSSQVKKVTNIPPKLSKPERLSCWPGPL
ncbi:testis-expressed protein 26-like [Osmerus mordax]|uniref:testis-expressed protein 26-like n=1 Tax=Osmerus mordax TaxID=8014 RepID=UPI00350EF749